MVLASLAAVATAAGAVWGLERADSGLTNIESTTQDVATDLLGVSRGGGGGIDRDDGRVASIDPADFGMSRSNFSK